MGSPWSITGSELPVGAFGMIANGKNNKGVRFEFLEMFGVDIGKNTISKPSAYDLEKGKNVEKALVNIPNIKQPRPEDNQFTMKVGDNEFTISKTAKTRHKDGTASTGSHKYILTDSEGNLQISVDSYNITTPYDILVTIVQDYGIRGKVLPSPKLARKKTIFTDKILRMFSF